MKGAEAEKPVIEGCCPGRFYLRACCECDGEAFFRLWKEISAIFYKDPYDNALEFEYPFGKAEKGAEHRHGILAFPIGDLPLVEYVLEARHIEPYHCDGHPKNVSTLRFLEAKEPYHHPFDEMMEHWKQRRFEDCAVSILGQNARPHAFGAFMYIRAALVCLNDSKVDNQEEIAKQATTATAIYADFHKRQNGEDSVQYANALLLQSLVLQKTGKGLQAILLLGGAIPALTTLKGYAHYVLGMMKLQHNSPVEAFGHFCRVDSRRIAKVFAHYEKSGQLVMSYRMANAHAKTPETVKLVSRALWQMGDRKGARQLSAQHGMELGDDITKLKKTNVRICTVCKMGGTTDSFLCCELCKDQWYCSAKCKNGDLDAHEDTSCCWCFGCQKKLKKRSLRAWCTGCYSVFYCDETCQAQHWSQIHSKECIKCNLK
jgi:hypothetical protein